MKRHVIYIFVGLFLTTSFGCGLTESEVAGMSDPTYVTCPEGASLTFEDAALRAELVVHARPTESFFVDHCHRAFLLDVDSVWYGDLPDHVLAIVRIDPYDHAEQWADLGRGETAVFLLERDPEVPEAFRPVGDGAVVAVDGGMAHICERRTVFGCETDLLDLRSLHAGFDSIVIDRLDHAGSAEDASAGQEGELDFERADESLDETVGDLSSDELLDEADVLDHERLDDRY